jgi:RNA polymerase sigma-70 factor (ECF subfamily)
MKPTLSASTAPDAITARDRHLQRFSEKYEAYFPRVFAFIYGRVRNVHLTEDLAADVFERAFVKSDSLRNDEAFSTWLFTIARNAIISHVRKYSRETIVDPEVMQDIAPATGTVEGELLMREELTEVAELMTHFPQREQDIVSLKFDAELSNTQLAEIMGLGEPNVRVILFRTLTKLREMMGVKKHTR